ncbi:ejaculatory bulb-specific protein 3-like [Venturia canescens]|uniref:ejaculatory bulb-specific protein 3-like n=1 Tax=Venturia canescens TaxID=32260 RepID=UPI001C9C3624|nr:ejaculatory bulb-specific protein 3-like [Venturia canescens]
MKSRLILALSLMTILTFVQAQDISALLADQRVVHRGILCLLDSGPCDAIGKQIKGLLPEAINNDCQRCNPRQRMNARKLTQFMRTNYANAWNSIVQRYSKKN